MNKNILVVKKLYKTYRTGDEIIEIFKEMDLAIEGGKIIALYGPSGSGKSTFLHLVGGLDRPDEGEIVLGNDVINKLSDDQMSKLRAYKIGYVFQFHHLLSDFSAIENVMIPQLIVNKSKMEAIQRAEHLLNIVGLKNRMEHKPAELSGGERQRVAIARALANEPDIVLADEPTGNLDLKTANKIIDLIIDLNKKFHYTFIIATHDPEIAKIADISFKIEDYKIKRL